MMNRWHSQSSNATPVKSLRMSDGANAGIGPSRHIASPRDLGGSLITERKVSLVGSRLSNGVPDDVVLALEYKRTTGRLAGSGQNGLTPNGPQSPCISERAGRKFLRFGDR
jgi:hypothetical protein